MLYSYEIGQINTTRRNLYPHYQVQEILTKLIMAAHRLPSQTDKVPKKEHKEVEDYNGVMLIFSGC